MKEALESVQEAQLDEALTRLFLNRMKTGEFDPPEQNPYRQIPPSAANSPKHQALAQNAAAEGLTLLKNNRVLPLSQKTIRSLSVIGPNANCTQQGGHMAHRETTTATSWETTRPSHPSSSRPQMHYQNLLQSQAAKVATFRSITAGP